MGAGLATLWLLAAMAGVGVGSPAPPYEVVKDHTDIEVSANGSFITSREVAYRILDSRGIEQLHERQIAFTQGYEDVSVVAAYTLKANGQRIDVPRSSYLSGFGQTSQPGFRDDVILSLFYPNLEVGDSLVLETVRRQIIPWFANRFDFRVNLSRTIPAHDVEIDLSAPASMTLAFDQSGLDGGPPRTYGDKKRWVWSFHNDTAVTPESDAVSETDYGPHLAMTSFTDWADAARAYRELSHDAAALTPEISALADQQTNGITDKRAQAKALYEWVSKNIAYVEITLGAGGFTPHAAKDILSNRFGDCKDHVVLLEALLKVKGIDSAATLISAGTAAYKLPTAATPHAFDHAITYLPAFDLYLDSTAQFAPFGVLPYEDTGKPVLDIATGELAHTPTSTPATSVVRATGQVTLGADGSAQGVSKITTSGAIGVNIRAFVQGVPSGEDSEFLRRMLGPGVDGTLERGDPTNLSEPYVLTAKYRQPGAISTSGPGALQDLALKPFSFTQLLGGGLPATRGSDYICLSVLAEQNATFTFPAGYRLMAIPDSQVLTAEGIRLQIDYERTSPQTVERSTTLRIDHPQATCTPDYYAHVHGALDKMANALREQIIYRSPKGNAP